ncbi:MAG: hypothetical protein LBK58_08885 [Prevotellaceae bacterium]|nr:hypothetical protein [Prevotellaceae bacterium]
MRRILLLAFVALAANNILYGQGQFTTQGNDFWMTYGSNENFASNFPILQIRIVAAENTRVSLAYTADATLNATVDVNAGQVYTRTLSASEKAALYNNATGISSKSLHITSNKNIALFAINLARYTTDATNVLPVSNLGVDYYHLSYTSISAPGDGYCIVATENGTTIRDEGALLATLNAGQVCCRYFGVNSDHTGKHITTNKPVAYFTVNSCVRIPSNVSACDCLFQQLVPVPSWGNRFLVPVTSRGTDRVRIVASQNGTVIHQTGGTLISGSLTLNAGGSVELEINQLNSGCYIVASKPVAVGAFLIGLNYFSGDRATGDPAFTWVPPMEQAVAHTLIAPFVAVGTSVLKSHYAMIVTPTSTRNTTTVSVSGGAPRALSGGSWTANAASGYSYYSMLLSNSAESTYEFQNSSGLTIMGYGLGDYESYYYMAAASARQLDPAFYVGNLHFQDINGQNICDADFEFRASIQYSLGSGPGKLKWYIDGTERTQARDMNTWTMPKRQLLGRHTVKLAIRDTYNQIKDVTSTFTVLAVPDAILSGNVSAATICQGATPEIRVDGTSPTLTYSVFTAPTGGVQVGRLAGSGGAINIPCTVSLNAGTTYYVESGNRGCFSSPRTPVRVNVVPHPAVPALSAATVCSGSVPVIRLATSEQGVNYNIYASPSDRTPAGTGAGTGAAMDISLGKAPASTAVYYVEAAAGSCLSTARSRTSVTVSPKPALALSNISKTGALCYGESTGSITVSVPGAAGYSRDDGNTWQTVSTFPGLAAGTYQIRIRTSAGCVSDALPVTIEQPAAVLSAGTSASDLSCYGSTAGGKIEVAASGGTPPYLYSRDGGSTYQADGRIADLPIGAYGIVVKDASGCTTAMETVYVSQPPALHIPAPVAVGVSCNGGDDGSISISDAVGGTPPYRYSFDNGNTYSQLSAKSGLSAGTYHIRVMDSHTCVSPDIPVTVAEPEALLSPADLGAPPACPNLPAKITISNTRAGTYYEIYDAASGGNLMASVEGNGASLDVNMGVISETATFYIRTVSGKCTGVSRIPLTVQVRKTTLNYPDIRIEACPNGSNINLSKYIDTLDLASLSWTGPTVSAINATTGIIGSVPSTQSVYTFKYNASSHCSAPASRNVYLHVATNKKIFVPRDTVAVCWKHAEALQINQMFGIEAAGTWNTAPVLSPALVHLSPASSPYAGALVFNGKAAYEDGVLTPVIYRGEPARQIEFYYSVPAGECFGNRVYKIVIVLTQDITK